MKKLLQVSLVAVIALAVFSSSAFAVIGFTAIRIGAYSQPNGAEKRIMLMDITGDGSTYAGGGFAVTAANAGLTRLDALIPLGCGVQGTGVGLTPQWDRLNGKMKLFQGTAAANALAEATAAEFASNIVCSCIALGE